MSTEIPLINQIYSFRYVVKGMHKLCNKELDIDFKAIFKFILYNHMYDKLPHSSDSKE